MSAISCSFLALALLGACGDGGSAPGRDASSGGAASSDGGDIDPSGGAASSSGGTSDGGGGTGASGGGSGGGGSGGSDPSSGCNLTSGLSATVILHVSPDGTPAGDGASFESALDYPTAFARVQAGEMILLEPGTYPVPYTEGQQNRIELSKVGSSDAPISVVAANCGRAEFDFSFPEQAWVQDSYGFYVTGSYWYFKGIEVTNAGYQGAYVTGAHNTFDTCSFHDNRNTGLEINKGGSYTTVIHSDAYRNYDPKKFGGMADGFGPKQTQGPGNVFIDCRAWENSDDGFDTFDSPETVVIEDSWAFRNGVDVWNYGGFAGNGNGFKLGGNYQVAHNRIVRSVAFGNVVKGFDQNNNAGGLTILSCTSYENGTNFGLGNAVNSGEEHLLRNNVSVGAAANIANADSEFNSWDLGITASDADFASVDLSLATTARNPDGTLPNIPLFRLAEGSSLIDAGVDAGLEFSGSAPDLGAFEHAP